MSTNSHLSRWIKGHLLCEASLARGRLTGLPLQHFPSPGFCPFSHLPVLMDHFVFSPVFSAQFVSFLLLEAFSNNSSINVPSVCLSVCLCLSLCAYVSVYLCLHAHVHVCSFLLNRYNKKRALALDLRKRWISSPNTCQQRKMPFNLLHLGFLYVQETLFSRVTVWIKRVLILNDCVSLKTRTSSSLVLPLAGHSLSPFHEWIFIACCSSSLRRL